MPKWLPVTGFAYEVSDAGDVRRTGYGRGARNGHVLSPQRLNSGYLAVMLWTVNTPHPRLVHRLVAEAFIGAAPPRHEINHINGIKTDNRAGNLEWVTRSENLLHASAAGVAYRGELNHAAKLTEAQVIDIRHAHAAGRGGYKALGKMYGVTWGTIRDIVKGRIWRHLLA